MALRLTDDWHGMPVWAWGGLGAAGLYLGYRWYRGKKAAAAAAASQQSGGATAQGTALTQSQLAAEQAQLSAITNPPGATLTSPSGAQYTGPASSIGQVLPFLTGPPTPPTGTNPTPPTTPTPAPPDVAPAPPPPTSSNASAQQVTIGGQNYYALGNLSPTGRYTGFNVAGGYPVLATWVGNGTPTAGFPLRPGSLGTLDLFTPADTPAADIGNYQVNENLGG